MKFLLPFILLGVSSRGDRAISGAIGNVPAGAFDDFQILLRNPLIVCGLREFHIGARLIARAGDEARLFRSAIAATVRPRSSEGGPQFSRTSTQSKGSVSAYFGVHSELPREIC